MKPRYRFRFGIGTIVTLLLAVIAGYLFYRQNVGGRPPIIQHQVTGNSPRAIAPVPEYLLRHKGELLLTAGQEAQIQHLAQAYRHEVAAVQQSLSAAAKKFAADMERRSGAERPESREIIAASAEVQRLSAVVFTIRYSYWTRACMILNPGQRQQAIALSRQATLADLH